MDKNALQLPALVLLTDYHGDYKVFLEAVYQYFCKDFVISRPVYRGMPLGLKKHPMIEGKEATFWHLVTNGPVEDNRLADLRRMERVRWPRPIIDHSDVRELKVWENKRGSEKRILIWHEKAEYLVVLAARKTYILPWTAYPVTEKNRKTKLEKEYQDYLKAETA